MRAKLCYMRLAGPGAWLSAAEWTPERPQETDLKRGSLSVFVREIMCTWPTGSADTLFIAPKARILPRMLAFTMPIRHLLSFGLGASFLTIGRREDEREMPELSASRKDTVDMREMVDRLCSCIRKDTVGMCKMVGMCITGRRRGLPVAATWRRSLPSAPILFIRMSASRWRA